MPQVQLRLVPTGSRFPRADLSPTTPIIGQFKYLTYVRNLALARTRLTHRNGRITVAITPSKFLPTSHLEITSSAPKSLVSCRKYVRYCPHGLMPALALHTASSVGGAQFYPGCFQINVAGTGTAKPPTIKFPGAYSATDPGIEINIYQSLITYQSQQSSQSNIERKLMNTVAFTVPGPTPYGTSVPTIATTVYPTTATWNTKLQPTTVPTVVPGAGSGSTTTNGGTTTVGTTASTTIPITTITKTSPTATSAGPTTTAGGAALYGQCGGTGWT